MPSALRRLIEDITVDAYDTSEQLGGFLEAFLNEVKVPVTASVLGIAVEVIGFNVEGDERRGRSPSAVTPRAPAHCRWRTSASTKGQ